MKALNHVIISLLIISLGCKNQNNTHTMAIDNKVQDILQKYIEVELNTDLNILSENEKKMLSLLFEVSDIMDALFWKQAYGDNDTLLEKIDNKKLQELISINYGPWDRLNGNISFVKGYNDKPLGANFYPKDMSKDEFNELNDSLKTGLYSIIRRNSDGGLEVIPYHLVYKPELERGSSLLR